MTKSLYILIFIICTIATCARAQTGAATRKQERKNIDSLLLVHSLPVRVEAARTDSLFRMDIQTLLRDSLKARKFESLNYDEAAEISKKYFTDLFGVNNKQRMLDNLENIQKDKDYFIKESEFAKPLMQSLEISACSIESDSCIVIKRYNFPNAKKYRSWEFKPEESESINQFVSRIINSLIDQTALK